MQSTKSVLLKNEQEMVDFAREFSHKLQPHDTLSLEGDLGTGKSTLARALIRELCGDPSMAVPSPTFTLVQMYSAKKFQIYHYDFYRLEEAEDVLNIGYGEEVSPWLTIIEWPGRAASMLPLNRIQVELGYGQSTDERILNLTLNK